MNCQIGQILRMLSMRRANFSRKNTRLTTPRVGSCSEDSTTKSCSSLICISSVFLSWIPDNSWFYCPSFVWASLRWYFLLPMLTSECDHSRNSITYILYLFHTRREQIFLYTSKQIMISRLLFGSLYCLDAPEQGSFVLYFRLMRLR